jgi:chromate transport protein ChrA
LPMFISELVDTGYMTESAFLYGLTLIQSLPGKVFKNRSGSQILTNSFFLL